MPYLTTIIQHSSESPIATTISANILIGHIEYFPPKNISNAKRSVLITSNQHFTRLLASAIRQQQPQQQ